MGKRYDTGRYLPDRIKIQRPPIDLAFCDHHVGRGFPILYTVGMKADKTALVSGSKPPILQPEKLRTIPKFGAGYTILKTITADMPGLNIHLANAFVGDSPEIGRRREAHGDHRIVGQPISSSNIVES